MKGTFYGVGVGPGDPELLTLKAVSAIKNSDVIIAPKTEKKTQSTALTIAKGFVNGKSEIVELVFPMNYDSQALAAAWLKNKRFILEFLNAGKKVAFLTLGDPMIFSTYIYIYRLLEDSGHEIINIPGVNSFCAIGASLGYCLAEGGDILSIIPANIEENRLEQILAVSDNIILMKVYKNLPALISKLSEFGFLENAVMVSKCGLEDESIVHDLRSICDFEKVNYLSTILSKRSKISKYALA